VNNFSTSKPRIVAVSLFEKPLPPVPKLPQRVIKILPKQAFPTLTSQNKVIPILISKVVYKCSELIPMDFGPIS
jgi:hypothetical protein